MILIERIKFVSDLFLDSEKYFDIFYNKNSNNGFANLYLAFLKIKKLDYESAIKILENFAENNQIYTTRLILAEIYYKINKLEVSFLLLKELENRIINPIIFDILGHIYI